MHYFEYRDKELYCEDVPVQRIADEVGTPAYIYSYKTLERHFRVFDGAFNGIPHMTCYSCKASSNISILKIISNLGGGVDIVSGGELYRAMKAGIPGNRIVYSGVGKTVEELEQAIRANILMVNIESESELDMVTGLARRKRKKVPLSIRVNPEIDPKTHPYITTGLKKNKFGILWNEALPLYGKIAREPYTEAIGISSHIGSQILELGPFVDSVRLLREMIIQLKATGVNIKYVDIGGGLGIAYKDELPPLPDEYARVIREELNGLGLTLILEPGRVIVGNSGIFVTKVLYVKKIPGKTFYIVDGAMNDLVRPALYNAYHTILPVKASDNDTIKVDMVGPICESGDFFAKDRDMPVLEEGESVAIFGAGAYGFSMSSNYNSRPRAPEVLVKEGDFFTIRRRELGRDLIRAEQIPDFLGV